MSQSQPDSTAGLGLPQVAACLLVGYFVFRWFFKSNDPSGTPQRRPPPVDPRHLQQQTEVIRGMFPQVSVAAVQAELVRNGGNIEITTEKILTIGSLPEPPASTTPAAPASRPVAPTARRQPAPPTSSASSSSTILSQYTDLITRYNLHSRLHETESSSTLLGKGKSPATKSDRQLAHHNKRDDMILAARRRMEDMDRKARATG